ncbi:MAG: hypothetical protein MSA09_06025 [Lachnospiraceae bacterium]|nr:hypothetical protein [Lachnospiraceae bacterium]
MHDNMSDIVRIIIIAVVSIGLTVTLLYFFTDVFDSKMGQLNEMNSESDEMVANVRDGKYTRYEDTEVSGSEVLNLIKKYKREDFGILVTIGSTTTNYCKALTGSASAGYTLGTGQGSGSLADAKDITKPTLYINPTRNYSGEVCYDNQGNIVGLHFTLEN